MASNRGQMSPDELHDFNPQSSGAQYEMAPTGSGQNTPWLPNSQQAPGHIPNVHGPVLRSNNPFYRGFAPQASHQGTPSRPPISPSASSESPEVAQQQRAAVEQSPTLVSFFSVEEVPRTAYTDQDLANIARLLQETGRAQWSKVPRIYTVLRLIGQVMAIDLFLEQGVNDMWFPFDVLQLPLWNYKKADLLAVEA
jgi:hypothetical protein